MHRCVVDQKYFVKDLHFTSVRKSLVQYGLYQHFQELIIENVQITSNIHKPWQGRQNRSGRPGSCRTKNSLQLKIFMKSNPTIDINLVTISSWCLKHRSMDATPAPSTSISLCKVPFMFKTQSAQTLEQVFLHACISINIAFNCGFRFYGGMTVMEYCLGAHYCCYLCITVISLMKIHACQHPVTGWINILSYSLPQSCLL